MTIQDLCAQHSDNDILAALETLPQTLQDIFDQRISRIRAQQRSGNAIKALKYCGALKRPLSVSAYQELLSLSSDQKSLDRGSFPNDMDQVWSDCCGLVFVDEEESTVHYVHQSVRKYLFDRDVSAESPLKGFNIETIDNRLGLLCMTYLDFSDFKHQLAKVPKYSNASALQPVHFGLSSISHSRGTTNRIAMKLLSNHRRLPSSSSPEPGRSMEKILHDFVSSSQTSEQENDFYFLEYAQTYWIHHTTSKVTFENQKVWALFRRCLKNVDVVAHKPWDERSDPSLSKADVITQQSHFPLLFLYCIDVPGKLEEKDLIQILRDCKMKDRFRFTEQILEEDKSGHLSDYALFYAAEAGCVESVLLSIKFKANPNAKISGSSPLQAAVQGSHLAVVNELLAFETDRSPSGIERPNDFKLVARRRQLSAVEQLLLARARLDVSQAKKVNLHTALPEAGEGGHLNVVIRPWTAGKGVHSGPSAVSSKNRTALQIAAGLGYLHIVQRLLNNGAGLDDKHACAALEAAANGGHFDIVERILAIGVKWDRYDTGKRAMYASAKAGHFESHKDLWIPEMFGSKEQTVEQRRRNSPRIKRSAKVAEV